MERKDLPIYKMTINDAEESGVTYVALVDSPAIQTNWFAFSDQKKFKFQATDKDRHIITGPLMIADLPIYRNTEKMGEFYVTFDAPTIEQIAQKFFKQGNTSKVNLMHEKAMMPEGVFLFESMIVDPARGINAPEGFKDITPGSWIGSYKVENQKIWDEFIKTGEFKGFSVEGNFDLQIEEVKPEDEIARLIDEILNISGPQ